MIEKIYSRKFKNKRRDGAKPKSSRIAFGSLIIKEIKRLKDEETVQEIQESPYLQYFIGYREFSPSKTIRSIYDGTLQKKIHT